MAGLKRYIGGGQSAIKAVAESNVACLSLAQPGAPAGTMVAATAFRASRRAGVDPATVWL